MRYALTYLTIFENLTNTNFFSETQIFFRNSIPIFKKLRVNKEVTKNTTFFLYSSAINWENEREQNFTKFKGDSKDTLESFYC